MTAICTCMYDARGRTGPLCEACRNHAELIHAENRIRNAGVSVSRETVNIRPMHTAHEPRRFAKPLTDDERLELMQLITQALEHVENIAQAAPIMRADIHKRTIKKKDDGFRPYTLKDAKSPARIAALRLRAAWDIVDPPLSKG